MRYFVLCVSLTSVVCAWGQECKQSVPVTILEEKTPTAVPSLTAEQLEVRIGKARWPLSAVEPIPRYRVLVLIDESASMMQLEEGPRSHPQKYLELINQTLKQVLGNLPPNVQAEYGVFNNKAAFGNRFTSDPKELVESVPQVTQQVGTPRPAKTALYDAIHEGLGRFDSPLAGDSILVVTDGGENRSITTEKRIRQELKEKGIRLFSILIQGKSHILTPEELSGVTSFRDLVALTGGTLYSVDTDRVFVRDEEAKDLHRYWTEEVLSGYIVHFNVPSSLAHDQKWRLSVKAAAYPKRKIATIYPMRLRACSLMTATAR